MSSRTFPQSEGTIGRQPPRTLSATARTEAVNMRSAIGAAALGDDSLGDAAAAVRRRTVSAPPRYRTMNSQFYGPWRKAHQKVVGPLRATARPCSPNRSHNPHPLGLGYQQPYNRSSDSYQLWTPEMNLILDRLPRKIGHSVNTNFSSGVPQFFPETDKPSTGSELLEPHFLSSAQMSYQQPEKNSRYKDRTVPTSRYGSNIDRQAVASGGAPNALAPWWTNRAMKPPGYRQLTVHRSL